MAVIDSSLFLGKNVTIVCCCISNSGFWNVHAVTQWYHKFAVMAISVFCNFSNFGISEVCNFGSLKFGRLVM